MKKLILVFSVFPLIAVLFFKLASNNELFAVSGCCKQRNSYTEEWIRKDLNFKECEAENRRQDGDNVFIKEGLVWWDTRC